MNNNLNKKLMILDNEVLNNIKKYIEDTQFKLQECAYIQNTGNYRLIFIDQQDPDFTVIIRITPEENYIANILYDEDDNDSDVSLNPVYMSTIIMSKMISLCEGYLYDIFFGKNPLYKEGVAIHE